jgi:predicted PurR-regulated permease PerM
MPRRPDRSRALVAWGVLYVVLAVVALYALWLSRQALLLVYVSALLAIGMTPLIRVIERRGAFRIGARLPRWLAILVVYSVVVGVLVGVALAVIPPLVVQARGLVNEMPRWASRLQQALARRGLVSETMTVSEMVQQAPGGDIVTAVMVTVWSVVGGVFGLITILIVAFYMLVEGESLFRSALGFLPAARRAGVRNAGEEITAKVSAWLIGQLMLAGTIGTSALVFLVVAGVPYFGVLALLAGIGELIPYVGPILAAIPAVMVAGSVSTKVAIATAIFYFVQQQVENHLLVPKLMERQVGLSALTVIVALLVGGSILGLPGVLLAVPTAAIVQVVVQRFAADAAPAAEPSTRREAAVAPQSKTASAQ